MSNERIRVASRLWCAVAHRGVGDEHPLLRPASSRPPPSAPAPPASAACPAAAASAGTAGGRGARASAGGRARPAVSGMAVDGDVGDVGQDLRRPVAARLEAEQLGRRVDELRGVGVVEKRRMLQQVLDERRCSSTRRGCGTRGAPGRAARSPSPASAPRRSPSPAGCRSSG